jgi:hypothetical protein
MTAPVSVKYEWGPGFHPPRRVKVEQAREAVLALPEPSPKMLLEASKDTEHVLHNALWSESSETWAYRGRLEWCRHLISAIRDVRIETNITVTTRTVEYISAVNKWVPTKRIYDDPELLHAHLADAQRRAEETAQKIATIVSFMRPRAAE